jgi:hypothetical protein
MNKFRVTTLALLLLSLFAFPVNALAAPAAGNSYDDVVIFGEDFSLATGETVDGTVMVFGGDVTLEAGSTVDVDVVSFGGDINIAGTVQGSVIALGGDVTLGETAVVEQDVSTFGGELDRAAGAQVNGNAFSNSSSWNFAFDRNFDRNFQLGPMERGFFSGRDGGHPILWLLFSSFAISTIALLFALFAPDHLRRTSEAILAEPVTSGGLGLLSFILLPIVLVITLITIIGPVIVGFAAIVAVAFGWIAVGLEVGRRLDTAFKGSWSPVVQTWLGTLVISIAAGVIGLVPCVGWIGQLLLASLGFGGVLLTRFGTRAYPQKPAPTRKQLPSPGGGPRKRASR